MRRKEMFHPSWMMLISCLLVLWLSPVEGNPFSSLTRRHHPNNRPLRTLRRPLVVGHRGYLEVAPENTMPSFRKALSAGVDGIETDLHLSSDGVIVLIHDTTLDRTTNCTGNVSDYSAAYLTTQCNAAAHFDGNTDYHDIFVPIPTLEEVLLFAGRNGLFVILDMKDTTFGIGALLNPLLRQTNMTTNVLVSCWDDVQLAEAREYLPSSPAQMLRKKLSGTPSQLIESATNFSAAGFSLELGLINEAFLVDTQRHLLSVFAWTVQTKDQMQQMVILGADGVITNNPTLISQCEECLTQGSESASWVWPVAAAGCFIGGFVLAYFIARCVYLRRDQSYEKINAPV